MAANYSERRLDGHLAPDETVLTSWVGGRGGSRVINLSATAPPNPITATFFPRSVRFYRPSYTNETDRHIKCRYQSPGNTTTTKKKRKNFSFLPFFLSPFSRAQSKSLEKRLCQKEREKPSRSVRIMQTGVGICSGGGVGGGCVPLITPNDVF